MSSAISSFRVPCQKCENCLKEDCGKCETCNEKKKSASVGASKNSQGKSVTFFLPNEKHSLKRCVKKACSKLQLSPAAECAVCRTQPKNKVLMECTSCHQVTHPGCVKSNISGVIISNEDNYWVCPTCCKRQCTAFCDEPCPYMGKHHELLASLIEVGDFSASDEQSKLNLFKECVLKYVKNGWNCDKEPVPDNSPKLHLPIMHLAVMLGKVKVLEWLFQQRLNPQYIFISGQSDLCSPLHVAVTHLEVGVKNSRGRKEVQINRFAHIIHLFLLNCPLSFTYKQAKTQDSFLHFLSQQCLKNDEGLYKDYLLATLQKLKEFRSKAKEISIKEVLCACNAEGNTFLHLIVQNDLFHDIVRFLAGNFDAEFKLMSGIKNTFDDTPRKIAADKGCIKVCEALGAPDELLKIIAKGDSVDVEGEVVQLRKEIDGKRKRPEEQQGDKLRKRKRISEEGKKPTNCSITSTKRPDSDTLDNDSAHRNENNIQAAATGELAMQNDFSGLADKESNGKRKVDSSVCIEKGINPTFSVRVSDCNVKSNTEQLSQSKQIPTQDRQEESNQPVILSVESLAVNSSESSSLLIHDHNHHVDTIQKTKKQSPLTSHSCDEMEGKSDKNESSHIIELRKSSQSTAQNDQMCSSRNNEKIKDSVACRTEPDESKRNESSDVTALYILDTEEKDSVYIESEHVSENSATTVTANCSSLQVANKHTVFCPNDCAVRHSKVLQSLQACTNYHHNSTNNIPYFMEVLDEYLQKEGKGVVNRPIADKVKQFRHPIVHWAAVLGKYRLLSYLGKRKDFDLSVKNPYCDNETAMHRAVLFLDEAFTKADPNVQMQRIFTTFSKLTDVFIKEADVIFGMQNSNGNTPFHLVAKAIVEVGLNRQLKCYDKFFKIMLEKVALMAQSSKSKFENVEDIMCKTNKEGETFLHVLTCRVGIGHQLVEFSLKVLPKLILQKLKKIETRYGKSASAIAADLGSHKLAALLTPTGLLVDSESSKDSRAERAARRDDIKVAHWIEKNISGKQQDASKKPGKDVPSQITSVSTGDPSGASHQVRASYAASSPSSISSGELWSPVEMDWEEDTYVLGELLEMDSLPVENTGAKTENMQQLSASAINNEKVEEFDAQKDDTPVFDIESEASVSVSAGTVDDETGRKTENVEVENEQIVRAEGEGQVTSTSAKIENVANQLPGPSTSRGDTVESRQIGKPSSTSQTLGSTLEPTSLQSSTKTIPKPTRKAIPSVAKAKACIISGIMRSPHSAAVKKSIVQSLQIQFQSTLESAKKSLEEEQAQLLSIRSRCNDAEEKKKELMRQLADVDDIITEAKEQERKCLDLCEKKEEECDQFDLELEKCETSLQKLAELI